MEETSRAALDVLRSDKKIDWVVEQLIASFSEGIADSAKESSSLAQSQFVDAMGLSTRERTKREKYETSRPYDENEKLELIRFALEEVFVTLPSMQNATAKIIKELGSPASSIEFIAPDEEGQPEGSYTRKIAESHISVEHLKQRLAAFFERLVQ
jgi:hypothetical protein